MKLATASIRWHISIFCSANSSHSIYIFVQVSNVETFNVSIHTTGCSAATRHRFKSVRAHGVCLRMDSVERVKEPLRTNLANDELASDESVLCDKSAIHDGNQDESDSANGGMRVKVCFYNRTFFAGRMAQLFSSPAVAMSE